MIWNVMIYDIYVIWYDMLCYDIWSDMLCYMIYMWYDMTCYDMIYDMICYDIWYIYFFKFYFACSITCSNTTCLLSYLQLLYNVYQYLQLLLYDIYVIWYDMLCYDMIYMLWYMIYLWYDMIYDMIY